jgi:ABC-type transport system involved in cytochrome c biogenesis permease subunit
MRNMMDNIVLSTFWYNAAIIGYVAALFTYIFNLAACKASWRRVATITVGISFLLQTLGMVFRWIEAGHVEVAAAERALGVPLTGLARFVVFTQHPPWSNLYEIMVYMSWGVVLVYLVSEVKWRVRFMGIFALSLTLVALGVASLTDGTIKPLVPALKSWWIMIHVISASIAYAAGTLAAIMSLLYLIKAQDRVRLSQVCGGMMIVSAFIGAILGRGAELFVSCSYKVKLLKNFEGQEVVVGRYIDDQFMPYFVSSPFVGPLLFGAVVASVISAVLLFRSRDDVPAGFARWSFFGSVALMTLALGTIVFNDLAGASIEVDLQTAAQLLPQGPWHIGFRSNAWDLALFGIVWLSQLFILLVTLFPSKVRSGLASAQKLDRVAYANVMVSFALVALVLVTGALWAHYAWGRYWAWDPKETGALVIWINYALYLHTRVTYGWVGPRSAVIGVIGFFIILAGFLGVNLGWFASGLHSYGSA